MITVQMPQDLTSVDKDLSTITPIKSPRTAIQVRDLNVWFGNHHVLKNVSIDIPEKGCYCHHRT